EVAHKKFERVESVVGVDTAGIPQGALVADALDLPVLYGRSKAKGHVMENMIEGKGNEEQRVSDVDDVLTTRVSFLKAVQDLKTAGFDVVGMVAIFTYGFEVAKENFQHAGIKLVCLSDYEALLPEAIAADYVTANDLESLNTWRKDPGSW